jgi:hypothetical protein
MGPFLPRLAPVLQWPNEIEQLPLLNTEIEKLRKVYTDIMADEFGSPYTETAVSEDLLKKITCGDEAILCSLRLRLRMLQMGASELELEYLDIDLQRVNTSSPTPTKPRNSPPPPKGKVVFPLTFLESMDHQEHLHLDYERHLLLEKSVLLEATHEEKLNQIRDRRLQRMKERAREKKGFSGASVEEKHEEHCDEDVDMSWVDAVILND